MSGEDMVVQVRLFAILRERAGCDLIELALPRGATVAEALQRLARIDSLAEPLACLSVAMAVNRDYAAADTVLEPDDELALIPPLSGGAAAPGERGEAAVGGVAAAADGTAAAPHVRVTAEPLSLDRLARRVADPLAGAIVTFQGVTRELPRLDYEAYTEMAEERIARIARECIAAHALCALAVEHRVGSVPLGEPSVIVAASAAHRAEAFAGAREAIDRVKAEAPIWKREHPDGAPARWVAGTEPPR
jgi:molybdopterin synthase catalytic subunit/molybdopterin converting factor small subunit